MYLFPVTFPYAKEWSWDWVSKVGQVRSINNNKVVAYNLACEFIFYGFWHWVTYSGPFARGPLKQMKYNPENQYAGESGHLKREFIFTTLGFLQSSAFQCVIMHLWSSGKLPYYSEFWKYPAWSIGHLLLVTYWREFHFYWVHRMMHPW